MADDRCLNTAHENFFFTGFEACNGFAACGLNLIC
jgi:hypothetical protein